MLRAERRVAGVRFASMDAYGSPLHVASTVPEPYVHLDNRSLVLHDGRHCVMYASSAFPWVAETIRVLLEEQRATRQQGQNVFGGFVHGEHATIYAGSVNQLATTTLALTDLELLRARLGGR
jgi:hypothetical protein